MELRYHTPLSAEEQTAQGLDTPQPLAMADKVRYAELDVNNHVNNKAYVAWFESLRVSYFDLFLDPHYPGTQRPRTVVHSLNVRFIREMLRDESYIATARISAFRNSSFTMEQQLWSGGQLRATANVVMVMLERDRSGRAALPDDVRQCLMSRDGAEDHSGAQ
ncbi:acyl-CoA thioesterase [Arenibacterium sp. CAU 1754]